jgi:hypothetical protein
MRLAGEETMRRGRGGEEEEGNGGKVREDEW